LSRSFSRRSWPPLSIDANAVRLNGIYSNGGDAYGASTTHDHESGEAPPQKSHLKPPEQKPTLHLPAHGAFL